MKHAKVLSLFLCAAMSMFGCSDNLGSKGQLLTCTADAAGALSCAPATAGAVLGANQCQDVDEDGDGEAHDDDGEDHDGDGTRNCDDADDDSDGMSDVSDDDDDNDGVPDDDDCDERDGQDDDDDGEHDGDTEDDNDDDGDDHGG